jgi:Arc/MetJ-type ribon-helix-helix transcriptional regulator
MKTPRISVRVPQGELDRIDNLVKGKVFEDRSAFLRAAIHMLLQHYIAYEESLKEGSKHV